MISTLEKEITFRFLKARKKDGFLNVMSIFSFIGISLGVAVLIIVMSVMNGFRTELINKVVGFNSHITVKTYGNSIDKNKINKKNLELISENIIFSNSGEAIILKNDTSALDKANNIYLHLKKNNIDAIIDDTDENFSSKIKKMNLIGAPYQIIIGKKSDGDLLEFKETGGETQNLPLNKIIEIINKQKNSI